MRWLAVAIFCLSLSHQGEARQVRIGTQAADSSSITTKVTYINGVYTLTLYFDNSHISRQCLDTWNVVKAKAVESAALKMLNESDVFDIDKVFGAAGLTCQ
jgi:hypothetical protein